MPSNARPPIPTGEDSTRYSGGLLSGPEGEPPQHDGEGALGSGFIIRADGLIVTNRHVIVDARSVQVKLPDGKQVPASVVGCRRCHRHRADQGVGRHSAGARARIVGGSVSPVTPSLRSATPSGWDRRSPQASFPRAAVLSTSTPTSISCRPTPQSILATPADRCCPRTESSSALLPLYSRRAAARSASVLPSRQKTVSAVIAELQAHGRIDRGYLGISAQTVTPAIGRALGVDPPSGALVTVVDPKGPSAGILQVGDVLLSLGSTPVTFEHLEELRGGCTLEALRRE